MTLPPRVLYHAWTEQFDRWFAAPGSVLMKPEVLEQLDQRVSAATRQ